MNIEMDIVSILSQVSLFEDLTDDELHELASRFQEKRYRKNNLIIFEDDQEASLFVIESGRVKISRMSDTGSEVNFAILGEGDFFGELSAIDGEARSADVTSMDEVVLYTIRQEDFLEVLEKMPAVSMAMIRELSRRLRFTDWMVQNLSTRDAEGRIAAALVYLAQETGTICRGEVTIPKLPVQRDLANMSGTSRETVSRTLTLLKDRKECSRKGRTLTIHDLDSFKQKYLG
jgi:CRP/FNR family transcriptional regulator/CRP/FNR family cyclic AMP-dependent transcriptional regulator